MLRAPRAFSAATALLLLAAPIAASAKEESKIRLFMEKMNGNSEKGMLRSQLAPGSAVLRVHVSHLAANAEHCLLGTEDLAVEPVEVARFTTNGSGNAELRIDLFSTGDGIIPSFDPRGKLVTVSETDLAGACTDDVLAAWVYADPADDPPRPRIKELTSLARELAAQGSVDARYDALPSGGARLSISLRGVVPGDYDVDVDGVTVASLTTNSSGFANVDLRIRPGRGNGNMGRSKPHKHKGVLDFNPRSKLIEVSNADGLQFFGPMLAQIPGLGECTPTSASEDLTPGATQPSSMGSVALAVETTCDLQMTLTLTDLTPGTYDLFIGGVDVDDIEITDAGAGTGSTTLVYDENPDAAGELPMPPGVGLGASTPIPIAIQLGADVALSGDLP